MDVAGCRIEVEVECAERAIWASPESRQQLHIHGWERSSWRHLDTCGFATVITTEVPRGKDEKRTDETVAVPGPRSSAVLHALLKPLECKFSARRVRLAMPASCFRSPGIRPIALWNGPSRGVWSAEAWRNWRRSAIDEKSFLSGQSYVSVLSDPKRLSGTGSHRRTGTSQCRAAFRKCRA
jgi:zinc-finger of transposase IS204/IS1001/IS1096/IS1165